MTEPAAVVVVVAGVEDVGGAGGAVVLVVDDAGGMLADVGVAGAGPTPGGRPAVDVGPGAPEGAVVGEVASGAGAGAWVVAGAGAEVSEVAAGAGGSADEQAGPPAIIDSAAAAHTSHRRRIAGILVDDRPSRQAFRPSRGRAVDCGRRGVGLGVAEDDLGPGR